MFESASEPVARIWHIPQPRIVREASWIALGLAISAIFTLAGTRALTELVQPSVFGTVSLLLGISALGQSLFSAPFLQAALRFYPDMVRKDNVSILNSALTKLLSTTSIGLATLFMAGGLVYVMVRPEISYVNFLVASGLMVAEVWRAKETSLLTAARKQKHYAIWTSVDSFARPLLAIMIVYLFGPTSQGLILGYLIAVTANYILFSKVMGINMQFPRAKDGMEVQLMREILKFSVPLIPLGVLGWFSGLSSRYVIGGLLGIDQVGIFAATYGLVSIPFLQAQSLVELTLRPVYYDSVSDGNQKKQKWVIMVWLVIVGSISLAGVIVICLFKEWIAQLLLASKYRNGFIMMPWIASGYAMLAISCVFEKICYAYKNTMLLLLIQGSGAFLTLVLTVPSVLRYGVMGAAYVVPIAFFVQLTVSATIFFIQGRKNFK